MSNILTTAKIGFEFTFECDPHQSTCWNSGNWTSSIKNDEAITPPLEEKYMASGNDKKDPFLSTPRIQATKAPRKSWGGAPFQDNREDRFPSWFSHVGSDVRDSKQFRQKHAAWLFQYPTWTQFQHDVSKQFGPYVNSMDDALHYQAINTNTCLKRMKASGEWNSGSSNPRKI